MADLAFDADVGRPLTAQLASGNPLFIVCHGPAAMLAPRIHGASPFKGYRVTCFTNQEEEAVGLASRATWLLETDIKEKVGVNFSCGEIWKPYMVEDHPRAAKRTRTTDCSLDERERKSYALRRRARRYAAWLAAHVPQRSAYAPHA